LAQENGRNLLAEMSSKLDAQIYQAQKTLEDLKKQLDLQNEL
jgi:hypothetical protein